jgi:hypothetical protein
MLDNIHTEPESETKMSKSERFGGSQASSSRILTLLLSKASSDALQPMFFVFSFESLLYVLV